MRINSNTVTHNHRTQRPQIGAVAVFFVFAILLTACGAQTGQGPTSTPTITATRSILDYTPQPTRDPAFGPPTLPPEYTVTPTGTHTATPTPTATDTATPTPGIEDICENVAFPANMIDGVTFAEGDFDAPGFSMGVYYPETSMVWIIKNIETREEEIQTMPGNSVLIVDMLTLTTEPGTYEWTVFITTPEYEQICEQTVTFTVLPAEGSASPTQEATIAATEAALPPSPLEIFLQNLLDQIRENRRATLTPQP